MPQTTFRVLVVDDHRVFADALAGRLADEPDLEVVGTANTVDAVWESLSRNQVDLVTLDLDLAGEDGLALASEILQRWPSTGIVIVTGTSAEDRVLEAVQLGIRGWVAKAGSVDALLSALRGAAHGETRLPAAVLTRVLGSLSARNGATTPEAEALSRLTQRELDVLRCLMEGMSRNEIGALLHVSPNTVRTHVQSILHKLKVHSALTAVALARKAGLSGMTDEETRPPYDVTGLARPRASPADLPT
jgi:DNA-binding NarL/FixJ family response regulator